MITDELVLPGDVLLVPIASVADDVRERFEANDDDVAITRPLSRVPSRIVDKASARLLRLFSEPCTVSEAVIAYSRATGSDPQTTLTDAYPVIQRLVDAGFLVQAGSTEAQRIAATFAPGDTIFGYTVKWPLQVVNDSEVYQVSTEDGRLAVLKTARPGAPGRVGLQLEQEAFFLAELDGAACPSIIDACFSKERLFAVVEWIDGVDVGSAAAALRERHAIDELIDLCVRVIEAFATLHARGVVHGDVHTRNVLVTPTEAVKIVDFGNAHRTNEPATRSNRAGVGFFIEPEAYLAGAHGTPSLAGEQYGLAALAYLLITGDHYLNFSLEHEELVRQVLTEEPIPFVSRGLPAMVDIERVLGRALAKDPADRFDSLAVLAVELRNAAERHSEMPAAIETHEVGDDRAYVDDFLERFSFDSTLFASETLDAPTASFSWGAAGVAYALWRVACVRDDPKMLALADAWINRAHRSITDATAWYSVPLDVTETQVGRATPYHTQSGVHAVEVFIALSRGDTHSAATAVDAYVATAGAACENRDLTLGRSGSLLVSALLMEALAGSGVAPSDALRRFGNSLSDDVLGYIGGLPSIAEAREIRYTGVAHGWAGMLYALLTWARSTRSAAPQVACERLLELADFAEPSKSGARISWNADRSSPAYMVGWCNGSAGFVHLWALAHDMLRNDKFVGLMEQCALDAYNGLYSHSNLCCGLAGQAYALNTVAKRTNDTRWSKRARTVAKLAKLSARRTPATPQTPAASLYKGELGVCLMLEELSTPEFAAMPLFESPT